MKPRVRIWPGWAKALGTALALYLAALALSVPPESPNKYGLLWPAVGVALVFAYYWGRPALIGVFLGALTYNSIGHWRWFSLLGPDAVETAAADLAGIFPLLAISGASMLQTWLSVRILRARMPAIREGRLSLPGWLSLLLLSGPLACLAKVAVLAFALGWITLPLRADNFVFATGMWVSTILSVWMAVPLIVIRELRRDLPDLAHNRPRNPWFVLACVVPPAWALAIYVGAQQVDREQQRFREVGAEFRGELQASMDGVVQKLAALRAFFRVSGAASPARFEPFANELLAGTPLLLGLNWAGHVADSERASAEAALAAQVGRSVPLSRLDADGKLVPSERRDEYWPLLRMAPDSRKAVIGFDLASEPNRRRALLAAQGGDLVSSARVMSAFSNGQRTPTVFLYLGTSNPRGVIVAPLKIETLLGAEALGQQLIAQQHGLLLSNADGEALATLEKQPGVLRAADPELAQRYVLKVGNETWTLTVTTAKSALPYLRAPLWWFGQTLPQLLCVLAGLFLALVASNDRQIFLLERQYAGYLDDQERVVIPRALGAATHDAAIERAWHERAFEPLFEPIVDVRSGEIRGAEALLRWPGAPPGVTTCDVIEWAERHSVIGALDHEMLVAALAAAAHWPLARLPGFAISVNVSASDLQHPRWAEEVLGALARHRISGRYLCVEITEGVLMRSETAVLEQLAALRAAGVRIALDDFGTGYSSIAYLRQLPVDRIKLDQAFVSDLASDEKARRIVASILALGRTLDIDLVAEAVEDERTARVLRDLGCPLAQGRLYSTAVDAHALHELLLTRLKVQRVRA